MALCVKVTRRSQAEANLAPGRDRIWSDAFPAVADAIVAVPGQVLIEADRDQEGGLSFIRGHGTYQVNQIIGQKRSRGGEDGEVVEDEGAMVVDDGSGGTVRLCACNAGIIERVNKLVTVQPPKARYQGAIGDLIVGRITEVGSKRWKVDLRGHKEALLQLSAVILPDGLQRIRKEAVLQLSAVILPDGLQRIRGHEDQLQMRSFYQEKDLISAEVQSVMSDGTVHLHTRTVRYGKLENGLLVYVRPALVRRSKHHFLTLPGIGIDVVLGNNGYVWVSRSLSKGVAGEDAAEEDQIHMGKAEVLVAQKTRHASTPTSSEDRLKIARVRNALLLLNQAFLSISGETILKVYHLSEQLGLAPKDLTSPSSIQLVLHHLLAENMLQEGS